MIMKIFNFLLIDRECKKIKILYVFCLFVYFFFMCYILNNLDVENFYLLREKF